LCFDYLKVVSENDIKKIMSKQREIMKKYVIINFLIDNNYTIYLKELINSF